jgi:hypothetical protein
MAGFGGGPIFQRYDDGVSRTVWFLSPKIIAGMAWPILDTVAIRFDLEGGAIISPGAGARSTAGSSPFLGASVSMFLLGF